MSVSFWEKIDKTAPNGCWEWTGGLNKAGYGRTAHKTGTRLAHRIAYEQMVGAIPEGLGLDHLCRNRKCVNPDHLEPVTDRVNLLRSPETVTSRNAAKTHCPSGHELSGANLYIWHRQRHCRECKNTAWRRMYWRRKAAAA